MKRNMRTSRMTKHDDRLMMAARIKHFYHLVNAGAKMRHHLGHANIGAKRVIHINQPKSTFCQIGHVMIHISLIKRPPIATMKINDDWPVFMPRMKIITHQMMRAIGKIKTTG